ncbi:MAG: phenylalanine--tRNA ligase subunit alpha [Dehalococcoidia bacterium]|nr:phenylalanine--tRNA ligase subunit alpha [Dehalococcoidia bacterium]
MAKNGIDLPRIASGARNELKAARDESQLEQWRVAYLGRKGRLTQILRQLGDLPIEERRRVGAEANRLKDTLEGALENRREELQSRRLAAAAEAGRLDVTLPGRPKRIGRLHPVTQTLRQIVDIFVSMGFSAVEGPEVETDYYNFEALLLSKDHPARDMQDTLYVDEQRDGQYPLLMRTHTSPNQVRYMERHRPPVRIIVPGKCYRNEATDPTHEWMITQVELLAIDEGISMADLKGTLFEFAKRMFGQERRARFRCDYFPYVEPGVDMAIDCFLCGGEGCRTCHQEGWIEIMGAGMVHPKILSNMGYDAERYTGFAAGMGIERIALLRHGVDDIRHFYANDLRFLEQF